MEKLFEQKLFAIVSNDYNAVTDALNKGELLSANHEGSPANRDIAAIATLLTGIQAKGYDQTRQGFFRRLLSVAHTLVKKGVCSLLRVEIWGKHFQSQNVQRF